MVIPRSRSRSIESSTCSAISRSARPPQTWISRSASVDFPWSMCAMMEKLRVSRVSVIPGQLVDQGRRIEEMAAEDLAVHRQHRDLGIETGARPGSSSMSIRSSAKV
jgi:hypothetical protein